VDFYFFSRVEITGRKQFFRFISVKSDGKANKRKFFDWIPGNTQKIVVEKFARSSQSEKSNSVQKLRFE
jgi:hypothetical protein